MPYIDPLNKGQQPCNDFKAAEVSPFHGGAISHWCPKCDGNRSFCDNCHTDHHQGGWENCKPNVISLDNPVEGE